jgi:hypothetical protein
MPIGSRGHLAYLKETIWGQVAEPATKVLMMTGEGIIQNIEEILSKASRGIVDEPKSYQGLKTFGGPVAFDIHPANFGDILRSAIWDPVTDAAASVVNVLEDCEDNWVANTGCVSVLDTTDYKTGSASVKIYVPAGVAAGVIIATEDFDAVNMTADDQIKLWIKCSVSTSSGNLKFVFDEAAACANPDQAIAIDALVANTWTEVTLTLGAMTDENAVISVGIEMDADLGECIVWIDDIRRIDTAGAASTAKDHVFTPSQTDFHEDCPLYPYTIEVHRDQAAAEAWQFLGCVVNTLNLKFGVDDKILNGTAGIIAKNVDRVAKSSQTFETTNPFTWNQAVINIATAPNNYLESMEINIDNKLIGIPSLNNTSIIRRLYRSAPREVTVNFVIDFVDQVQYDLFVLGTEQALQIVFTGAVTAEAGFYYTLTIDMPAFRYLTYPITNPGSNRISVAVTGKAKYSVSDGYAIKVTLRNYTADY